MDNIKNLARLKRLNSQLYASSCYVLALVSPSFYVYLGHAPVFQMTKNRVMNKAIQKAVQGSTAFDLKTIAPNPEAFGTSGQSTFAEIEKKLAETPNVASLD